MFSFSELTSNTAPATVNVDNKDASQDLLPDTATKDKSEL